MEGVEFPYLARLVNSDELWAAVRDFDRILSESKKRLPVAREDNPLSKVGYALHEFAFNHFHLMLVFRFKAKEIGRGIFASWKEENPAVIFNLARALVEHTASLAYQDQALRKAVKDISSKQNFDQILVSIASHKALVQRLYYGGEGSPVQLKRVHVNDLVDALEKIHPGIRSDYDRLCEFVHPNYSSNTLVSSGDLALGIIGVPSSACFPELRFARDVIENCADVESRLIFETTKSLIQIGDWITLSRAEGVKISQILSLRSSYVGDGKNKDSAIFFSKARTHHEARKAFYAYLEKEGIELRDCQIAGIEDGFLFETVSTNRGDLWIKYKMTD